MALTEDPRDNQQAVKDSQEDHKEPAAGTQVAVAQSDTSGAPVEQSEAGPSPGEGQTADALMDEARALMPKPEPKNGEVEVKLSGDRLQAFLLVIPPEHGGAPASMADVTIALGKTGVQQGIDEDAIKQALEEGARPTGRRPRPVLIARGQNPVPGKDAYVTYCDILQQAQGVPQEREDGGVDFFNMNVVRNVTKGTVLATKTPATKGIPGRSVTGDQIVAPDGKDIRLKPGKGVVLSEDGLQIIADIEGHVTVNEEEHMVAVLPVYEVAADVGPETGNIDFVGSVIVRGNILMGYMVKATQDLEVRGGIDGGSAEVGGHLVVRYGIQGAGRGRVVAGGNVTCRFMENANVQAKGDITVSDGILHSVVQAGGKILAPGRKGLIVGGQARATEQIVARVLGSSLATPTEVEVGTDPKFREEMQGVLAGLREVEESIKKTYQVISFLKEVESNRPAEFTLQRKEGLLKALHSLRLLVEKQNELKQQKADLDATAQLAVTGTVKISDVVFPGVRVTICGSVYLVDDTLRGGNFYYSTDEAVVKVG